MTSSSKGPQTGSTSRPVAGKAKAPVPGGVKETPIRTSAAAPRESATPRMGAIKQARLARQEQRRRNQQLITGFFVAAIALVVIFAGITIYNAIPKPTPPAPVYGILSDFANNKTSNIKGVAGKVVTLPDGVQYVDVKVGTGATVATGATVTSNYTGWLTDGTSFDASSLHGGPQQFSLAKVIKGWQEAIPGMKIGGERRLLIPAAEAYGATAQNGIPANSTLIFDVSIVSIP